MAALRSLPLALAAALLAQTQPSAAPSDRQLKPGSLEGTVVDSVTHAPIRKATVSMAHSEGFSRVGITDEAGKFQIGNAEPGSYKVEYAHAQGYLYQPPRLPSPILVAEGQRVTDIALGMLPLGAITGKVVDDDGEPLQGAQVAVMAYDYSDDSKSLKTADGAVTDDRGEYRVFNLKPGRYFVHAWSPAGQFRNGSQQVDPLPPNTRRNMPELGYVPVFYPNVGDVSQAMPSQVAPGSETAGVDFRLRRAPVYYIRGKLAGPAPGGQLASVIAVPCQDAGASAAAAQHSARIEAGRFDIEGVAAGVYCLTLYGNAQPPAAYASETVTIGNRGLDDVTLVSAATFQVPGVVQFDGLSGDPPAIRVGLGAPSPLGRGEVSRMAQMNGDQFTFSGAAPGDYHVTLYSLPQTMYLKAMRYGADDVSEGIIRVKADGDTLTLVIGTGAGQLSGTVQTGNNDPAIGVTVTIAPDRLANRHDLFKTARTDSTGRFRATGLAPGEYKVYAWDDPDVPMAEDSEFRQQFSSRAEPVTISPSGAATVTLKAIPAEEIRKAKERF